MELPKNDRNKVTWLFNSPSLFLDCNLPPLGPTIMYNSLMQNATGTMSLKEFTRLKTLLTMEDTITGLRPLSCCFVAPTSGGEARVLMTGAKPLCEGLNHWRFIGAVNGGLSDSANFESRSLNLFTRDGNLIGPDGLVKEGAFTTRSKFRVVDLYLLVTPSHVTVEVTVNGLPQPCVLHLSCLEDSLSSLRPIVTSSEGERAVICDFPEGGYSRESLNGETTKRILWLMT